MISLQPMKFFLFFITVWGGGHAYIAHRLIRPLPAGSRWRPIGWSWWTVSLLTAPLVLVGRWQGLDQALFDMLAWIAYVDMGFFLVLIPLLVTRDSGWILFRLFRKLHHKLSDRPQSITPENNARRQFLANTMNAGMLGLTGGMTIAGYNEARRLARVKVITIPVRNLPADLEGFHIVQLSDIHLGPTIKGDYLQGIVERSNELNPDMVAITGDLVDGLTNQLQKDVAPLTQLRSRHGSFFVTGNHEYYWDAKTWSALLKTLGIKVLLNENRIIQHGSARLMVAGVTDYAGDKYVSDHLSDPRQARHHAERADASVLLAHQPRSAFAGEAAGYDLQLSGHVHGGQFFPWNLFINLVQPFSNGLHKLNGRMWLYVSAGTGYWGPPQRLGVPPEITSIKLRRA
jgi:predicted MPP superfamily phosphohydrolase